jgi:hypothetical protein
MHSFLPQELYTVWCLSKLYTNNIFVKITYKCFQREEKRQKKKKKMEREKKAQTGTSLRNRVFNGG